MHDQVKSDIKFIINQIRGVEGTEDQNMHDKGGKCLCVAVWYAKI